MVDSLTGLTGYAAYRMMNPEVSLREYIEQRAAAIQAKQRQISCGTAQKVKAADPVGELTPKVPDVVDEGTGRGGIPKREQLLSQVENSKLKNAINEIYRPGANVGDGGLADAVRHEISTGDLVGGKSHLQKARERVTNLENIIKKQELSNGDLEIANALLNDLKNALGGK